MFFCIFELPATPDRRGRYLDEHGTHSLPLRRPRAHLYIAVILRSGHPARPGLDASLGQRLTNIVLSFSSDLLLRSTPQSASAYLINICYHTLHPTNRRGQSAVAHNSARRGKTSPVSAASTTMLVSFLLVLLLVSPTPKASASPSACQNHSLAHGRRARPPLSPHATSTLRLPPTPRVIVGPLRIVCPTSTSLARQNGWAAFVVS